MDIEVFCFVFIHTYGESICIQAGKLKQRIRKCCESLHMLYPQFRIDKFQVIKSSSVHELQIIFIVSTDSDKDCPAVYASCRLSSVMSECVWLSVCVFYVFSNLCKRHRYLFLNDFKRLFSFFWANVVVLMMFWCSKKSAHCHWISPRLIHQMYRWVSLESWLNSFPQNFTLAWWTAD